MAWSLVQSNVGGSASAGAFSIAWPATPIPGNLLIAVQTRGGSTAIAPAVNSLIGFTLVDRTLISTTLPTALLYKIAGAAEPSVTFTAGAGVADYGQIYEFSGNDPINPLDQHNFQNSGSALNHVATPFITPTYLNGEQTLVFATAVTGGTAGAFTSATGGFSHIGTDADRIISVDQFPNITPAAAATYGTTITYANAIRGIGYIASFFPQGAHPGLIAHQAAVIRRAVW